MQEKITEVTLVYKCDTYHRRESFELLGVATEKGVAISMILLYANNHGETISDDNITCLQEFNQTQYYEGPGEFQLETHKVNVLL